MRQITFKNSTLFDGAIDESGGSDKPFVLTNISGVSAGGKWDLVPFKGGGTRADLDNICGVDNSRCKTNDDGSLNLKDGMVQWDKEGAKGLILAQYLDSPEGQKAAGAAGGIQGWKGTLFGVPYATGSWQDKLVVAFEGTHDVLGGQATGLYDAQGNTKRGMGEAERFIRDRVSEVALIPSAPFAAATLLPPEMWNAISIVLKAAK
jgi:filamentous hemagglutinin